MKKDENNKNMWQSFNDQRTDFFVSVGYLLIECIIPGILIWVLIGNDFSFSFNKNLPHPIIGYVFLVCIIYLIYSVLCTCFIYHLNGHKADNFTYVVTIAIVFFVLILLGYAFKQNNTIFIIIKLVIILLSAVVAVTAGVFLTYIARNNEFKRKELVEGYLKDQREGKSLSEKMIKRIESYNLMIKKREEKQKKFDELKAKLDLKIEQEYQLQKQREEEKKNRIIKKLDKKEELQRAKQQKKENKKNKIEFK
ncbi:DxFTY motif-containing membrane protein [Spiroplasma tabanidicola]|uniref:Uncharacterized protein n=1 Tax=Spiroplasma tabanidicola TaxID=324079 RepID=A0A6I6CAB8_9MOLU|nr:hypothetical protein [Spiroplasma tabanidicola]QGS51861.1 hypothetical protein STABA_v1c04980 [Spiroplasma tabanidicola]